MTLAGVTVGAIIILADIYLRGMRFGAGRSRSSSKGGGQAAAILFINALVWSINLPGGYIAETHGNLTRTPNSKDATPSQITLRKNLCRDERPEVHVFYRRADLKH